MTERNIIQPNASQVDSSPQHWCLYGASAPGTTAHAVALRSEGINVVGRSTHSEIHLTSSLVSGRHAALVVIDEMLFVRDLSSTNGTFLNGKRITGDTPCGEGDLIAFADVEFEVQLRQDVQTATQVLHEDSTFHTEFVKARWAFSKLRQFRTPTGMTPHAQPIVTLTDRRIVGFELLARGSQFSTETAQAIFDAARQLDCEAGISNLCRERAIRTAAGAGLTSRLFVNTHPAENLLTDVLGSLQTLKGEYPEAQLVIELSEGAIIQDIETIRTFRQELQAMGIEIAYDDFGAGHARLRELLKVPPDYIKFDLSFVSDIDTMSDEELQATRKLIGMIRDLGVATVAEGIESLSQYEATLNAGFDLGQGYLFGRPKPIR